MRFPQESTEYFYQKNIKSKHSDIYTLLCISVSCLVVSDSLWPIRLLCPWNSPGKNTGVDCHFLLQGIFPTQGLNLGLPHCKETLYQLSHQGRPLITWEMEIKTGASQVAQVVKNTPASPGNLREVDSIPGSGRSPGGGSGNPLQYSCLGKSHGHRSLVGYSPWGHKSQTRLSDWTTIPQTIHELCMRINVH